MEISKTIKLIPTSSILKDAKIVKKKRTRKEWAKNMEREKDYKQMPLLKELRESNSEYFKGLLRFDRASFLILTKKLHPYLAKKDTVMRRSIRAEERLLATLRFLATGKSYTDLSTSVGICNTTLSAIIPKTCNVIYEVLKDSVMKIPETVEDWKKVSNEFKNNCQMINCGGILDGVHIRVPIPKPSSTIPQDYCMILVAMINSNYEFMFVDVVKPGEMKSCGFLSNTLFYEMLRKKTLNLPTPDENDKNLPFVFIGNSNCGPEENILAPFLDDNLDLFQKIYNDRLSNICNIAENTFGLIASTFRVLHRHLSMNLDNIKSIVLAICVLHNFLIQNSSCYVQADTFDCVDNEEFVPGSWRSDISDGALISADSLLIENSTHIGEKIRINYLNVFTDCQ